MSSPKAKTKRPPAKPAPAKARQAPRSSARVAPKKIRTLGKNAEAKPPRENLGNAGKGRLKGVPNAVTKTAREIFQAFVECNALKLQELFDRVAKKSPAKALSIYAKLAEFVIPKLQRTELSGHVTSGEKEVPAWEDVSPEEAMRMYQEMIQGGKDGKPKVTFKHLPSVKPYVAPPRPEAIAAPRPAQEFMPAPARPEGPLSRSESAPEGAESVDPETNVLVILPKHDGEHRPIVDSKCPWCRKLWQERQRANEDELLRVQRPPQVIT